MCEAHSNGLARKHACVVRGGSFNNNADNARCANRNDNNPNNRNNNIGFRVVLSTFFQQGARNCGAGEQPAPPRGEEWRG